MEDSKVGKMLVVTFVSTNVGRWSGKTPFLPIFTCFLCFNSPIFFKHRRLADAKILVKISIFPGPFKKTTVSSDLM